MRDCASYEKLGSGEAILSRRALESLMQLCDQTDPYRQANIHGLFTDRWVAKADRTFAARWLLKLFEAARNPYEQIRVRVWELATPQIADDLIRLIQDARFGARRRALHVAGDGLGQGLLGQRASGRKELHGPAGNDDVFALRLVTACREVVVKGRKTDERGAGRFLEGNENINVQRGRRFQIKHRSDRAANGVLADNSIRLHLVDDFQRGFHLQILCQNRH